MDGLISPSSHHAIDVIAQSDYLIIPPKQSIEIESGKTKEKPKAGNCYITITEIVLADYLS
uniref:Uncharacterized protein n=1 Tax=Rhizophora mucronata TaxID=61149 RepID=A0A2P2NHK8_RHIMU